MPVYLLITVTSLLVTLVITTQASTPQTWLALVYSLGFAHYFMSLVYAKRQFAELAQQPNLIVPIASAVLLGVGLYVSHFPLLMYFALHHAFNEVYVLNRSIAVDNADVRMFRGSAVLLHLLLYLFLLRYAVAPDLGNLNPAYLAVLQRSGRVGWLPPQLLFAGLAVSYVIFFSYLYRIRSSLDLPTRIDNCAFELLGILAVVASFYVKFTFLHIVLYHFVFWTLFPAATMYTHAPSRLFPYAGLTILSLGLFLLLSPIGTFSSQLPPALFQKYFILLSYLHITASFVLSNAHPQWIVDLFRPSPVGKTVVQPP